MAKMRSIKKPGVSDSIVDKPGSTERTIDKPSTMKHIVDKPGAAKRSVGELATARPATARPAADKPVAVNPFTAYTISPQPFVPPSPNTSAAGYPNASGYPAASASGYPNAPVQSYPVASGYSASPAVPASGYSTAPVPSYPAASAVDPQEQGSPTVTRSSVSSAWPVPTSSAVGTASVGQATGAASSDLVPPVDDAASTAAGKKSDPTSSSAGKGVARVMVCCFSLVFLVLAVATTYAFFDTNTVSQSENRTLTAKQDLNLSTWFDGSFMDGFESYLSDHLLDRDGIIGLAQAFDGLIERDTGIKVQSGAGLNDNTTTTDTTTNDMNDTLGKLDIQEAAAQKYVVLDDRVIATYQHNEPTVQYFETAAQYIFAAMPSTLNKYLMVVPSRVSFETDEVKAQSDDPKDDITEIYASMPSDVTTVDAYSALSAHASENTYFRTDHHWTMLGAYYGARAFFDAAGVTYIPIDQYAQLSGAPFLGYLYASFPSTVMQQYPDDLIYYVYNNDIKNETVMETEGTGKYTEMTGKVIDPSRFGYYTFVATSFSQAIIDGNTASDRVLMVVSDSYMQAIAPWFADNFSKVILIDPRYYEDGKAGLESLISQYGVTDFLLLQSSLNLPYATFSTLIMQLGE